MFCQLLSESFEFFWVFSKFFLFPKFFFFNFGFLHVHMCSFFFLVLASEGLAQRGRHCHDSWQGHSHMSHICDILDPFWEVMWKLLIWLPNLYINNSHTKGFLCLARINSNFLWDTPGDWGHVFMCIVFIYLYITYRFKGATVAPMHWVGHSRLPEDFLLEWKIVGPRTLNRKRVTPRDYIAVEKCRTHVKPRELNRKRPTRRPWGALIPQLQWVGSAHSVDGCADLVGCGHLGMH